LVQVLASGQKCILNGIFCVGCIAQVSISPSIKHRKVARENLLHFPSFFFEDVDVEALFAPYG
jgi:hypothetical protein